MPQWNANTERPAGIFLPIPEISRANTGTIANSYNPIGSSGSTKGTPQLKIGTNAGFARAELEISLLEKLPSMGDLGVLIVGTGFGGICMALRLREAGYESFGVIEQADDVGGTWRDNRYPGCACDVPSHLYSLSFAPKDDWSRLYPQQSELLEYLHGLVKQAGIAPHIRLKAAMAGARWDETTGRWHVTTSAGDVITAQVLVLAVGALHVPAIPPLPGIDGFKGAAFHSSQWRSDYESAGKRVAVIGTGASAIQIVPELAPEVEQLFVYQRSAPWVLPKGDRPIGTWEGWMLRHLPGYRRLFRSWLFWRHEVRLLGLLGHDLLLRRYENMVRRSIARAIKDPHLR